MATLKEQISNRCKHFTGIQNKHCALGVLYSEVRFDKPYKFPCLNQGGQCNGCVFPTEDEVELELNEINNTSLKAVTVFAKIKDHKDRTGEINCDCGGKILFAKSRVNGHVSTSCIKCDFSIQE